MCPSSSPLPTPSLVPQGFRSPPQSPKAYGSAGDWGPCACQVLRSGEGWDVLDLFAATLDLPLDTCCAGTLGFDPLGTALERPTGRLTSVGGPKHHVNFRVTKHHLSKGNVSLTCRGREPGRDPGGGVGRKRHEVPGQQEERVLSSELWRSDIVRGIVVCDCA